MKNENNMIHISYNHESEFYDIEILGKHIKIKDQYKLSEKEKDHIKNIVRKHYFNIMPKEPVQIWISSRDGGFFRSEDKIEDVQKEYKKVEKILNDFLDAK